jgi:diphthine-ammonia ligase
LFRKRIVVREDDRRVVDEGGGSARLSILRARVEDKPPVDDAAAAGGEVRIPDLLDARFAGVMQGLGAEEEEEKLGDGGFNPAVQGAIIPPLGRLRDAAQSKVQQWCAVGDIECRSSIETEASSLVETVRARLSEASLPPTSIINTVIILRDMANFPAINKIYGSLFPDPNPPSRVTISSGDLLPRNCNIALYLSVHPDLRPSERQGLHVQSRSYWAPANIGPYSQATAFPLSSLAHAEADASSTQLVHIAGQIPLVPATMDLPPGGLETFPLQLALSLQHLWRVGVEMGVQWWSSAVAYIPHDSSHGATIPTIERAKLAAQAWTTAHRWFPPDAEDSDAEGGPDLWDRKFNPLYMSFAESETEEPHTVPDWSVLEAEGPIAKPVPFVFTAEVQELPRQADVEWHAHVGLAHVDTKSVRVVSSSDPSAGLHVQHTVVKTHNGTFIHSVLALERSPVPVEGKTAAVSTLVDELNSLLLRQLSSIAATEAYSPTAHLPTLLYTGSEAVALSADDVQSCPIIPCASLWDSQGKKLAAVAIYQNFFEEAP